MSKPWVVYAKTPLGGPAQVLEYLSRYTHKTAISNERIKSVSAQDVSFTARANDKGGKRRITLPTPEFIRLFLLHVLPGGIKRIRHYGVLANGCKVSVQPTHLAPPEGIRQRCQSASSDGAAVPQCGC